MKSLNLAVVVSTLVLMASGVANAQDDYRKEAHNQNFMSKRPYHQPLPDSAYQKGNDWEGATLVRDGENLDDSAVQKNQAHRTNQLSRRPY